VKRLRKFRNKNWFYVFSLKLGIIFYSMTVSILYLTGATGAYFNDTASVNGVIQAGTWSEGWDKSSLTFVPSKKPSTTNQCAPITVTVKNGGDRDMQGPVNYDVWWAEKGNPKDGVKVGVGEVRALKSGESLTLSYLPTKNGNYKFKVMQRPGHPGQGELWSEEIAVTNCEETKETKENNSPEKVEEGKTPEQEQEQQQQTQQPTEPAAPGTAPETTEQVPPTQSNEGKEDKKPDDSPNTEETPKGTTQEASITTPIPQSVEQNETQKDDSK
jgi:YqxM protein